MESDEHAFGPLATILGAGISLALHYFVLTLAVLAVMSLLGLVALTWSLLGVMVGLQVLLGCGLGAYAYWQRPAPTT